MVCHSWSDKLHCMRAILFACSAISGPLQPSWVRFFFFFLLLHSCRMLKPSLDPGQLCHILSTAVTHFLFPFQINVLTSFTAFTYKKKKKPPPKTKKKKHADCPSKPPSPEIDIGQTGRFVGDSSPCALTWLHSGSPLSFIILTCLSCVFSCSICDAWRISSEKL